MLTSTLDHIIRQVLDHAPDTSDILAVPDKHLQAEVHGKLADIPLEPNPGLLKPRQTEAMAMAMIGANERLLDDLMTTGSCDLSYELAGRARFRVNVFSRRGSFSIVMRQLSSTPPTMEQLSLPEIFREMAQEKYGLVLVTGATGSGKSTSLAALIDMINREQAVHIVTLEDPVEFVHEHKRAVVNQRELGIDFNSFASGLRAALRQAPKVILVGEIRDRETMEIALQAAETGHLVLGTLHTSSAGQTVSRIIGLFDSSEEELCRMRLSESLKFVVAQRLVPKVQGGRAAAFEIMRNTLRVKDLIMNGESGDKTFYNVLESGSAYGMTTFDQCLYDLFERQNIDEQTAMLGASDKSRLKMQIDALKTKRGESVTDISGLEIDTAYGNNQEDESI